MSTLLYQLRNYRTERVAIPTPFSFKESWERDGLGDRYELRTEFMARYVVTDGECERLGGAGKTEKVKRAEREVADAVFGEYRKPLLAAMRAIDKFELDEARTIIAKVLSNFDANEPMGPV